MSLCFLVISESIPRARRLRISSDESSAPPQDCILRLSQRFPDSPRIRVLEGMLLEVLGKENEAKAHYEKMLKTDETSIVNWPCR